MKKYIYPVIIVLFFIRNTWAFEFLDGDAYTNKLYSLVFNSDSYIILGGDVGFTNDIGVMSYLYSAPFFSGKLLKDIADKNNIYLGTKDLILKDHEDDIYEDRWILFGYTFGFSYLFSGLNGLGADDKSNDLSLSAILGLNAHMRYLKIDVGVIGRHYSREVDGGETMGGEDLSENMLQPYYSIKFSLFNLSPVISLITSDDSYNNPYYITGNIPVKFKDCEISLKYIHITSIDSLSEYEKLSYTRYSARYIQRFGDGRRDGPYDLRRYFMFTVENVFNDDIDTAGSSFKNNKNYVFRGEFSTGAASKDWGFPVIMAWGNTSKKVGAGLGKSFYSDNVSANALIKIKPISETTFIDRYDGFEMILSVQVTN